MESTPQRRIPPDAEGWCNGRGVRVRYRSWGDGPPLVLVHGWGVDTLRNWVDPGWVEALRPLRCVIGLDVRGHGLSDKPREPAAYTYSAMGADIVAALDDLGIERADFFGYSMGAFIGAYLLGHNANRFASVILGGIGDETPESAGAADVIAAALRAADPADVTDPLGRSYRQFTSEDPNNDLEALAVSALTMWPDGYPRTLGGPGLQRATNRVLIVNGVDDRPYVDTAQLLADVIPNARYVEIPGADHVSAVWHPGLKTAVTEFLTGPD